MSIYNGGRIVPKHCGTWDKTKEYEPLSVVLYADTGDSYTSKKTAPAGTAITDTEYWVRSSVFSAQLELLSDSLSSVFDTLETLKNQVAANVSASTDEDADYAAELVDARVGADGTTYTSVGEANRTQFESLFNGEIDNLVDVVRMLTYALDSAGTVGKVAGKDDLIADNCYVSSGNGVLTKLTSTDQHTGFIEVFPEDYYLYHGYLEGGGRAVCVYSDASEDAYIQNVLAGATSSSSYVRTVLLQLPEDAKYIRASCNGQHSEFALYRLSVATLAELKDSIDSFKTDVASWQESIEETISEDETTAMLRHILTTGNADAEVEAVAGADVFSESGYINVKGEEVTGFSGDYHTDFIAVDEGKQYLYKGYISDSRAIAFYSDASEDAFMSYVSPGGGNSWKWKAFAVPTGAVYMRCSCYGLANDPVIYAMDGPSLASLKVILDDACADIESLQEDVVYSLAETLFQATSNAELTYGYYLNGYGNPVASTYGDYITDYIEIEPNTKYLYTGRFSDARCLCQYDSNKKLVKAVSGSSVGSGTHTSYEFTSELTAHYFRGGAYGGISTNYPEVSLVAERVTLKEKVAAALELVGALEELVTGEEEAVSYESNTLDHLFATDNAAVGNDAKNAFFSRRYVQTLYPESFLNAKLPLYINGRRSWNVQRTKKNTDTVETEAVSVTLGGDGYADEEKSFDLISVKNSVLDGAAVRLLAIGDSLEGNTIPDKNGDYTVGWNHSAEARRFALLDGADLGIEPDFLCLGTCHYNARAAFTYGGTEFSMKACDEGRGSWATPNYLRHFAHTTTTSSGSGSSFHNRVAWDSLGLGRKIPYGEDYDTDVEYEEYSYTTEQRKLIRNTPHGYYHWDYSEALWTYLKSILSSYFTETGSSYEGSEADMEAIDAAMEYRLDNPSNPFFDRDTALATGNYAFSLKKYLERYRTLDDDGETRLVVGDTAGSLITVSGLKNYDVCTPTHVTIELGENDRWWFPNDYAATVTELQLMAEAIHTEYPDIIVGFVNPRYMGVFYPERWNDVAVLPAYSISSGLYKYNMNEGLREALGTLDEQHEAKCYLVPTYHCTSALSFSSAREDTALASGEKVIIGISGDINHAGCEANATMGYQILSWIYYTLANE